MGKRHNKVRHSATKQGIHFLSAWRTPTSLADVHFHLAMPEKERERWLLVSEIIKLRFEVKTFNIGH